MVVSRQSASGAVVGLVGLLGVVSNPNFDKSELLAPGAVLSKWQSDFGYSNSGKWYAIAYAALAGAAIGLGYNAFTGRLYEKKGPATPP